MPNISAMGCLDVAIWIIYLQLVMIFRLLYES